MNKVTKEYMETKNALARLAQSCRKTASSERPNGVVRSSNLNGWLASVQRNPDRSRSDDQAHSTVVSGNGSRIGAEAQEQEDLLLRLREVERREAEVRRREREIALAEELLAEREVYLEEGESLLLERGQEILEAKTELAQIREDLDKRKHGPGE